MKQNSTSYRFGQLGYGLLAAFCAVLITSPVVADPPLQPLPKPHYSFDDASPSVEDGTYASGCALRFDIPQSRCGIPCEAFGLCQVGDDLDSLATGDQVGPTSTFALVFTVGRGSIGAAPPEPALSEVPYNVFDQAAKGQAAGDAYVTTSLFTRSGPVPNARATNNNVLIINNYDEGGNDFNALPTTSAAESAAARNSAGVAEDNVNALTPEPTLPNRGGNNFFYSATGNSPSLPSIVSGVQPSGANLYLTNGAAGTQPDIFMTFGELGLNQEDDIGALIVFDDNGNGSFDGNDQIFLTLAPGSPSLTTIDGANGDASGADVFVINAGAAPVPALFAPAARFGLAASDTIDGLYLVEAIDAFDLANQAGIRGPAIPTVSEWGLIAMTLSLLIVGTVVFRRRWTTV